MGYFSSVEYMEFDGAVFFTVVLLPQKEGTFPTVIFRTPYVQDTVELSDDMVMQSCLTAFQAWLNRGYAVVFQHCRGQGKSSGAFVPYIHEHEDGLALRKWIRRQPFYNGEIFLCGGSYGASLHYSSAPFEDDIQGAVLEVQDTERYRLWYRNGQMRKGHANWHFGLYKSKCGLKKNFSMDSFSELPLAGLSERALGDMAEDFEQMLFAPHPEDPFWNTRFGGVEARNATDNANIPILFTTGYNDFYIGGMFRMWDRLSEQTKKKCAMLVSPYNHGDSYSEINGIAFPMGNRTEQFGQTYPIDWFDHIRKGTSLPYPKGVITYYRTFENRWQSDFSKISTTLLRIPLGEGTSSFRYDPLCPTSFSCEGIFTDDCNPCSDYARVCTKPFDRDLFIKGQMRATLAVSSNCKDSSFYVQISIKNSQYTYVLRHDITSLCYQLGRYTECDLVTLDFCFDEYAFLLKKGEVLQIDIASTDNNAYVSHTNKKGEYALQTDADVAINTVYLGQSYLFLPVEE